MNFTVNEALINDNDAIALTHAVNYASFENMIAIELGSWTGRSSIVIAEVVNKMNGILYCIDRWESVEGHEAHTNKGFETRDVFGEYRSNIIKAEVNDVIVPLVTSGDKAAKLIPDNFADFIFIDADHRYSHVKNDILTYWPKLKIGGVMCGHDYDKTIPMSEEDLIAHSELDHWHMHCGVIRAVDELFTDKIVNPMNNWIWIVEKIDEIIR